MFSGNSHFMKKSAQRIQNFQQLPAYSDIPAPLWLRIRDAPAETFYPEHVHAWGEFIYAFDGVLEVNIEQIHYLTPPLWYLATATFTAQWD
jgi:pyruvate-formate lyase-activating enzyme